jgi:hypothetical protein
MFQRKHLLWLREHERERIYVFEDKLLALILGKNERNNERKKGNSLNLD